MNIVLCSSSEKTELLHSFFGAIGNLYNEQLFSENILSVFYKTPNVSNDFSWIG